MTCALFIFIKKKLKPFVKKVHKVTEEMCKIYQYEYSNFSQNGQDGIIEYLSNKITSNNKYFVEIGCGNGLENNSTNLVLNNWSGLVCDIPPNINLYKRLLKIIQPKKRCYYKTNCSVNLFNNYYRCRFSSWYVKFCF